MVRNGKSCSLKRFSIFAFPLLAMSSYLFADEPVTSDLEDVFDLTVNQALDHEAIERQQQAIDGLESRFGPYDIQLKEAFRDLGSQYQRAGDMMAAYDAFKRALHLSRINEGLFNEAQLPIVEGLIDVGLEMASWEEVNNHYAYLEHLYRKLYGMDDPRLEEGLRKVVAWHIDASNFNLNGNRMEHLRKVNGLMKLRLQIAELTLSGEDPLLDSLRNSVARSEYYLYMNSDISRELYRERSRQRRDRYVANRE